MRVLALLFCVGVLGVAGTLDRAEAESRERSWSDVKRIELRVERNTLRSELRLANQRLRAKIAVAGSHPLERNFLCIKSYEATWTDPNAPYWGGMQMDRDFMRTYGPEFYREWGTADNWPISAQIATAMRAYLSGRGFYPWPNTARHCGLLG